MLNNDNNLLLIILVGIILFMILNINITKNKDQYENYENKDEYQNYENKTNDLYLEKFSSKLSNNSQSKNIESSKIQSDGKKTSDNLVDNRNIQKNNPQNSDPTNSLMTYNMNNKNNNKTYDNEYMLMNNSKPDPKFSHFTKDSKPTLASIDLLPREENDKWFQVPNSKFDLMAAVDLEVPEIKIGIDTVGTSRKNATYDIRTCPPNPKFIVSPWANSTIEPDYNTKPLC